MQEDDEEAGDEEEDAGSVEGPFDEEGGIAFFPAEEEIGPEAVGNHLAGGGEGGGEDEEEWEEDDG